MLLQIKKIIDVSIKKRMRTGTSCSQYLRGMTYVELIVVLGIFAIISAIGLFNYGLFQAKVDIKNLASDISLKLVEAQRMSLSGNLRLPVEYTLSSTWKPSYAIHFNSTASLDTDGIAFNKKFILFADLDNTVPPQNNIFDGTTACTAECLEKISITKGNYISAITVFPAGTTLPSLSATFSRIKSGLVFSTGIGGTGSLLSGVSYVQITIASPKGSVALIKLYPSGRVQIN